MQPLVELRHVTFGYGAEPALKDISLHLHPGQFAALVGPSGAGKTSLLKLILSVLQPTRGEVYIDGQALDGRPAPQVGYVPQLETVDWNFPVTVEEVVLLGRVRRSGLWPWPSAEDKRRVQAALERLEIADLARRHIRDLSGGQQQRVFLARALIAEPDLLVLDEPTAGVDMRTAENVLHMLAGLNQQGMTILMTTHDLNTAAAHVPWIICLNRRVIAQGTPEQVFNVETLNETYQGDMLVIRQDGMLFVQQKPHGHTYREVLPNPVPGHSPESDDGLLTRTVSI
ncbi:MAG: metal ABC transporter ATP-binding protein [Anaerolineae bacterium]|nr:metal ABC transporter ATP-binding protein [Anaerolineae bacterium]GIK37239.1 MAG: manganese transport system ATP-binding protein MntB [Chloroflexota bacterium]